VGNRRFIDVSADLQRTICRELDTTADRMELMTSLNVSRETLQNHRFLKQLQRILTRKAVELFLKISTDDPEKFKEISKIYGNALRIGMLESEKDKLKIAKLLRFQSTTSDYTSLEEVSYQHAESQS
jgi:heat shock protein beta